MLSHNAFVTMITDLRSIKSKANENDVHLSFLPLPHLFERMNFWSLVAGGSTICIYGGDPLKLKDDIALVKPTLFYGVPRIYNKFYSAII